MTEPVVYTFDPEDMIHVMPLRFRSHNFKIRCAGQMWHPSWWSFFDELEERDEWWTVQPGDHVLDAGADYGSYTLTALACGAANVVAWAPGCHAKDVEALTLVRSISENSFAGTSTIIIEGLYDRDGWIAYWAAPRLAEYFDTEEAAREAIVKNPDMGGVIKVRALDDFSIERADWLKIDTEGAELPILKGGIETIKRCRPRIILEHHYHLDADCELKCDEFLARLDYIKIGTKPHGIIAHSLYVPRKPA